MSNRFRFLPGPVLLITVICVIGCGHHESETDYAAAPTAEASAEITISAENIEAVRTVLTAADKLDGAEDGVVDKCPGCALHMDGSAEHTMTVADHELHFCSDSCRGRFAEHAEESLVALEIPAP